MYDINNICYDIIQRNETNADFPLKKMLISLAEASSGYHSLQGGLYKEKIKLNWRSNNIVTLKANEHVTKKKEANEQSEFDVPIEQNILFHSIWFLKFQEIYYFFFWKKEI